MELNSRIKIKILYHRMIDYLTEEEFLSQINPRLRKLLSSQIHQNGDVSYAFFSTLNLHQEEAEGVTNELDYFIEEIFDLLVKKFHPLEDNIRIWEYNSLKRKCVLINLVSHYRRVQDGHSDFREVRLNKTASLDIRLLAKIIKNEEPVDQTAQNEDNLDNIG